MSSTGHRVRVALLGGSSAFTPGLARELARAADELPPLELVLLGRDPARTEAVAAVSNALARRAGADQLWQATTSLDEALPDAGLVVNQVRVGGFAGREHDERFPLAFGYPGDETIGPGGLASALRAVPVVRALGEATAHRAPDAWFLNLSNPLGILVRALGEIPGVRALGLCELPARTLDVALARVGRGTAPGAGPEPGRGNGTRSGLADGLDVDYLGTNHQGWFTRVAAGGEDLLPRVFEALAGEEEPAFLRVSGTTMRRLGALPLPYLRLVYHCEREVARARARPTGRGRELAELSERLHAHWSAFAAGRSADPLPPSLRERDMPWLEEAVVPAIAALLGGAPRELYVSERNDGHVPGLPDGAVVEKRAILSSRGATAAPWSGPPPGAGHTAPLVEHCSAVVEFERRALAAAHFVASDPALAAVPRAPAVRSSRASSRTAPGRAHGDAVDAVVHALVVHPFGIPAEVARAMAPEVLRSLREPAAPNGCEVQR